MINCADTEWVLLALEMLQAKYCENNNYTNTEIWHMTRHRHKGASPQGSILHQMVSESWNFTGQAQMCALRQKCF